MKGFWFRLRAKQILAEMEPEATFVMDGLIDLRSVIR